MKRAEYLAERKARGREAQARRFQRWKAMVEKRHATHVGTYLPLEDLARVEAYASRLSSLTGERVSVGDAAAVLIQKSLGARLDDPESDE